MKTIQYTGVVSPWYDALGGSGLTWTTGMQAELKNDVADELLGYVTIFMFISESGSAVTLPNIQAAYDSGSAEEKAAFQSSVSGGRNDTRKLANWFAGGFDGRTVLWWGDSTTERWVGMGQVAYAGGYLLSGIEPALTGRVNFVNHGSNGQTLAAAMGGSVLTNAGGKRTDIAGIVTAVTPLVRPLVVISFGINDIRQLASIAGTSYGSAAQIAAAGTLRNQLQFAAAQIVAANQNASVIFRMPNAHAPTSSFLINGVTGQNAMDVYRLTYRGDTSLGLAPLDDGVQNAALFDSQRVIFGETSYANSMIDADGLHLSTDGDLRTLAAVIRMISGPEAGTIGSANEATAAARYERTVGHGPARAREIGDIKYSGEWEQITDCTAVTAQASHIDISFSNINQTPAWGAASGLGYGTAAQPAVGVGDVMIFEPTGLSPIIMPIARMGDSNNSGYIRWYGGGPDGYYPTSAMLPDNTRGSVWRHKWSGADNARRNAADVAAGGVRKMVAKPFAYHAFVTSTANGSIVLRGIGGRSTSLAAHTITTADTLCLLGVDDTARGGIPLTSATFTGPDTTTGALTITLAGRDFTKAAYRQAVILSAT